MSKRKRQKLIHDPMRPQLFSNEDLGLPPCEYEYRVIEKKDEQGRTVRQRIPQRTMDSFIRAAQSIWGDAYDYSESVLVNMKAPITIRCKKHDHYFTVPFAQNHIIKAHGNVKPTGCDLCEAERIGYYPKNRGHHHIRTPEEIKRDEEEKARRREERERLAAERKAQRTEERLREQQEARQREEQALLDKWHVKTVKEARFAERVHQMYGDDLDTSIAGYVDDHKPVVLICRHHGVFRITPRQLLRGERGNPPHGCWKCSGLPDPAEKRRMTAKQFYGIMRNLYMILDFTKYRRRKIKPNTKITAVCMKHGEITHDAQWWLDGKGCEYCHGKFYPPDFLRLAHAAQGEEYQYKGVENIKTTSDRVMVHCGNPDHQWHEMIVWLILQGSKCRECAGRHVPLEKRCQDWIARSDEKYRGEYDYHEAPADYINNDSKVWLTHKVCGTRFQVTPDTHLRGVNGGCPLCNLIYLESEGERTVRLWLEDHHIDHRTQEVIPNEDKTLPLEYLKADFYIDDFQRQPLIIEYNGQQHYEYNKYYHEGRRRNFKVQQHRDRYLRRYCSDHHIRLLEIPYWDFDRIGEILTEYFDNGEVVVSAKPKDLKLT